MFSCQTVVQPDVLWSSGRERWGQRYLRQQKTWRKTWRQNMSYDVNKTQNHGVKVWHQNFIPHDIRTWHITSKCGAKPQNVGSNINVQNTKSKYVVKTWRQYMSSNMRQKLRQNAMTKHDVKTWPWNMGSSVAIEVRLVIAWCQEYDI